MERRTGRLETVPMIGHIVSWVKKFSRQFGRSNELQELEPDEISRIARDFGVSVSDLHKGLSGFTREIAGGLPALFAA